MNNHRIKTSGGKYEFVSRGHQIDILRYGEPWVENVPGSNAIASMMMELDAARLVLDEVRQGLASKPIDIDEWVHFFIRVENAMQQHAQLVGDTEAPTEWCK